MIYLIEQSLWKESSFKLLLKAIEKTQSEYEIIEVRPFETELTFNTNRKDVFCFGSTKMAALSNKYNWNPGSLLNNNHNYEVYSKFYKDNLLNYDSLIFNLSDVESIELPNRFFTRPTLDNKAFTGAVMYKEELMDLMHHRRQNGWNIDFNVQVSTIKNILQEYRFWIVDGKISTQSLYKLGSMVLYREQTDEYIKDFVYEMLDIFQLAECFVMDVAVTDNGLKIIECGCINSAGFYDANLTKLLCDLEDWSSKNKMI